MSENRLEKKFCRDCGKEILVCRYTPHPLSKDATGIAASRWRDDCSTRFVGWICLDCAWKHATTEGDGGILGGGETPGECDFIYG